MFEDNERDYKEGRISRDEFIRRANELNMRMDKMTGGSEDKGLLDRTLRAVGNAAECASWVIPGVGAARAAITPARRAISQALRTGTAEAGFSGGSALREGED